MTLSLFLSARLDKQPHIRFPLPLKWLFMILLIICKIPFFPPSPLFTLPEIVCSEQTLFFSALSPRWQMVRILFSFRRHGERPSFSPSPGGYSGFLKLSLYPSPLYVQTVRGASSSFPPPLSSCSPTPNEKDSLPPRYDEFSSKATPTLSFPSLRGTTLPLSPNNRPLWNGAVSLLFSPPCFPPG